MKKNFRFFALIWAIVLVVFNVIAFVLRPFIPGNAGFDAGFWIGWAFVLAAFAGNLFCAFKAFKATDLKKTFYRLSLITVTWSALVAMIVAGGIVMLIPKCPAWIAAIVCLLVLAYNAVAVIKASWAVQAVEAIDEKVKSKTAFIKLLTVEAEGILARAQSDAAKAACKKVYEAVRYSNLTSSAELSDLESRITDKKNELSDAVNADDAEKVQAIADEMILLIGDRNRMCKALK